MTGKGKGIYQFDPRIQLLMLGVTGIAAFLADPLVLLGMIGFLSLYMLVQGIYKPPLLFILLGGLFYQVQQWTAGVEMHMLTFLVFFAFLGLRLLPILMISYSLAQTPSGKLMAALQALRLPNGLLITLAVSTRFIPVMRLEHEAIQLSAKLRGLALSTPRNWLRPLSTFEYSIVPLLMRSLKISDELAAAAATKGIDYPGKKTSLYQIAIRWEDVLMVLIYLGILAVLFQYGGMS